MKRFRESIKKTIKNFDIIFTSEKVALSQIDFHETQWIMQEESWTSKEVKYNQKLWNDLVALVKGKYPNLVIDD